MKPQNRFTKFAIYSVLTLATLSLIAWSPPTGSGDQKIILGTGNTHGNFQGSLAGNNNTANSQDGSINYYGLVVGNNNAANKVISSITGGSQNTTFCSNSLVAGYANSVGVAWNNLANNSMAVGNLNQISSDVGWTVGHQNTVNGSRGTAIGVGVKAINTNSTALGRYNAQMNPEDVLVIGTGTGVDPNNRSTALRVTADGGVILGRAQGDISMGIYGGN